MKLLRYILPALLFVYAAKPASAQQKEWTEKGAQKWVTSGVWANGLPIKVYSEVDAVEFAKQYSANKEMWDKVFAYMKNTDLKALPVGKYPIVGNEAYASVTEGPDREFDKTAWESHRKYIDLQYIVVGQEKMGKEALAKATVTKPYDEAKDGANYEATGKYYVATPSEFFLFFPGDVHRPNIKVNDKMVKKLVIKIKYSY